MSTLTLVPLCTQQTVRDRDSDSDSASDVTVSTTRSPVVVGSAGVTIGRAADSDVVLEDPQCRLSRMQAVIGGTDGFRLRNVGQGGPVRLDGQSLTAGTDRSLSEGQQVQIGTHRFLVRIDPAQAEESAAGEVPLRTVAMVPTEEPRTELLAEDEIERLPNLPQGFPRAVQGYGPAPLSPNAPWPVTAPVGQSDDTDPFADLLGPAAAFGSLPAEWADPDARIAQTGRQLLPGLGDRAPGPVADDEIERFIEGLALIEDRADPVHSSAAEALAAAPVTDAASGTLSTAWRPPRAAIHRETAMSASPVRTTTGSAAETASDALNAGSLRPMRTLASAEPVGAPVRAVHARQAPRGNTVTDLRPSLDANTAPAQDDAAMCAAFWQAAGLPEQMGCRDPTVMAAAGALLHAAVDALLQQQAARTAAKHVSAVQVTTIQPRDNNPLKFSPDAGSAIAMLLRPSGHGFKVGPDAVRALTADLTDHHAASTAASHGALHQVLRRLDPATVESFNPPANRLEAWLPKLRAARLWASYRQQYQRALAEGDEGWRAFAERRYAQAYQDHLHRRREQRKGNRGSGAAEMSPSPAVDPSGRFCDGR